MTAPLPPEPADAAPGDDNDSFLKGFATYALGLALALALTGASFLVAHSHLLWGPGIPVGLAVLAIAQMGVHLVFFLHITTGPDDSNNVLALGFGIVIVFLVITGSIWIMAHLSHLAPTMSQLVNMQA